MKKRNKNILKKDNNQMKRNKNLEYENNNTQNGTKKRKKK